MRGRSLAGLGVCCAWACAAVSGGAGCSSLLGIQDGAYRPSDGSAPDADLEASAPDGVGSDAGACPSDMVRVPALGDAGAFCIHAFEVTNHMYTSWLASKPDAASEDPRCSWNKSFAPDPLCRGDAATTPDDDPVTCVDWCDAYSFCNSYGLRLCGQRGGGSLGAKAPVTLPDGGIDWSVNAADQDEWFAACSNDDDGQHLYSAGNYPYLTACNGMGAGYFAPWPKGTLTCMGGVPGLYDMSGNVWEWEDACDTASSPDQAPCRQRGGSYHDDQTALFCRLTGIYNEQTSMRSERGVNIGFRCCAD